MKTKQIELFDQEKYVIDTWALIEYFEGTTKGKFAKRYIEKENVFIPEIVFLELADIVAKGKLNQSSNEITTFLNTRCTVFPLSTDICKKAGIIKWRKREKMQNFGILDAVILAVAETLNCRVISGDPHLKSDKRTIYLD